MRRRLDRDQMKWREGYLAGEASVLALLRLPQDPPPRCEHGQIAAHPHHILLRCPGPLDYLAEIKKALADAHMGVVADLAAAKHESLAAASQDVQS